MVIREVVVLRATIRYLVRIGATLTHVSVAGGKGINSAHDKTRVKRTIRDMSKEVPTKSAKPKFPHSGPDVIAASRDWYWQIECKGAGTGKPPTQRNNFDRALASVVSYYGKPPPEGLRVPRAAKSVLGLALPATPQYLSLLDDRVGQPLRQRLNLWVLLYDPTLRNIRPIGPSDGYPY